MNDTDAGAVAGDGRWMTYGELAEARQIGRRAAIRLAQRHRLQRMPGNDGMARVLVPTDMASSSPHRPTPPVTDADDTAGDTPVDVATPFHARALAALEDALAQANSRADAALALADRTLAQLADATAEATTLRGAIEELRAKVARSEDLADRARAQAQEAVQAAEALRQAEEARKAGGRLRRAWDGWRGR